MAKSFISLKGVKGWHHSIAGKITQFLLAGILIAFGAGACAGWGLIDSFSYQQWVHQAEANAQIMTYIVRNVYTNVAVGTSSTGQITRIVSEHKLGDPDSVIQTGYNPVDVLALASVQTRNPTWLFLYTPEKGFQGISNNSESQDASIRFKGHRATDVLVNYYIGFATINGKECFISAVPILAPSGEILGSLISSIGNKNQLYAAYDAMLKKTLVILALILLGTLALVTLFMRRLFRPVPLLINSLTRIAHEQTDHITPYLDQDDEIGRLAAAIEKLRIAMVERDYLQRMQDMSQKMEYMAHHDSLTGFPNRASFSQALDKCIREMNQNGQLFNLLLIDLDNFKPVNDTFGHSAGDEVLIGVAQRLSLLLGPMDFAARLGGDEFAILQSVKADNCQEAGALSQKIVRALSIPFTYGTNTFAISCSVGIVTAPDQGNSATTLMINADLALYASKHSGRGCYHFFEDGMMMKHTNSVFVNQEIINGIDNNEFVLHYQPIIDLENETVCGYESLIRWNHPTKGMIYPDYFINIAEESGLIIRLGEWIIRQSCMAAAKWPESTKVAVNISAYQLHGPGLIDIIIDALKQSGLAANRLEIEVTESEKLDQSIALPVFKKIREMGISIAMDDLGTGYAALDYLLIYPFTRIKIARTLIMKLEKESASQYLVVMLIQFAQKYGMSVTAEGVETEQQRTILRRISCQNVQGYYYSRPLPEKDLQPTFGNRVIDGEICNAV
ncbi:EAL domain-containing protein [Buttiauxella sp. 3AFRM03]|uniref:putative bifunctional diguanylate cyclase/phosphodiesterase n=1 Tax=Buttiauxella sp. 3AFRM03 TaxID=2479367 RepID=UPI000EF7F666|nr:EAL domain-containing protein [Buttiauxella sp. 3AFRM03]AYN29036.1 EAL domain-containing protein [Buttiauxella sp. 3AFRM03]